MTAGDGGRRGRGAGDDSGRLVRRQRRQRLAADLRARAPQIEREIFARVRALAEPASQKGPEYEKGLRVAIAEALAYALLCIELGDAWPAPIPMGVLSQSRLAAREGVELATVLRRYLAGNTLLEGFIAEAASGMSGGEVRAVLRELGPPMDRLMQAVAGEFAEARRQIEGTSAQRRAERLRELLAAEGPADTDDIEYDFEGWHVGAVFFGREAAAASARVARVNGSRALCLPQDPSTGWVWLGSPRPPAPHEVEGWLEDLIPDTVAVALGAPRPGLPGWRLSHREARAVTPALTLQRSRGIRHAHEVALLAAVLNDEALVRSLLDTYVAPLESRGESGRVLRETLRAYIAADTNVAAAAATLNVTRHTVQRRLRTVEGLIGQLLPDCYAEVHVALQLDDLDHLPGHERSST